VGYSVAASGTWGWVCSAGFISSPTILYGIFGAGGSGLFYESSPEWSSMLGALGRGRAAGGGPERREARPGSAGSSDRGAQGPNGQGFHRAKRRRSRRKSSGVPRSVRGGSGWLAASRPPASSSSGGRAATAREPSSAASGAPGSEGLPVARRRREARRRGGGRTSR